MEKKRRTFIKQSLAAASGIAATPFQDIFILNKSLEKMNPIV